VRTVVWSNVLPETPHRGSLFMAQFPTSHKKINRANKHIADIHSLLLNFANHPDCYSARIHHDAERRQNFLCIDIREDLFPLDDVALTIGDALHNLRSALDLMFYQVVLACGGTTTQWTRFPVCDAREELVDKWLKSALKRKQITTELGGFIIDKIKPYETGNPLIWSLHQMNISDKHEFFVPVLKLVGIVDVRLEDDKGDTVGRPGYLMDESCRIRLMDANDRQVTIKSKGHASAAMVFGRDTPFEGNSVIPSLAMIAKEVSHTIDAFEALDLQAEPSGKV
jgi:hypothetical protein